MLYKHNPDGSWEYAPQSQKFIDQCQAMWDRNRRIAAAKAQGKSADEIAREFNLKRARVSHILQKVEWETERGDLPPRERYQAKLPGAPKPRCPHCGQVIRS